MLLKTVLGLAAVGATADRTPVVLVADVGVDDAAALIWLAKDPTIDLLGVAASFGCHGDVRQTAANARRVLRAAGRPCVPVYVGSPYALGESTPPSDDGSYVHGEDGLGSVAEAPEEARLPSCHVDETLSAAEFIAQTARERAGITIIVTSPLTNLALAYLLEPHLPELVTRTLVMGGAVRHPGNVSPLAEANFAHDARAARLVVDAFSSEEGDRLVIAPLDVTMVGAVDHVHVASELDRAGVAQRLLAKAWRIYIGNYCTVLKECGPTAVLHDAHTVAYLRRPDLYDIEMMTLEVSVGGASNGHSLLDRRTLSASDDEIDDRTGEIGGRKRRCAVLVGVDAAGFKGAFLNAVAPPEPLVNVSLPIVKEARRFVHVTHPLKA
jgi:purine nucleosidase